jgi:hypothetical protein
MRSLYFEVCTNLELLDAVDIEKLGSGADAPGTATLLCSLETGISATVVLSENGPATELYGLLTLSGEVKETEDEGTAKRPKKTVLEAIFFCLRKITVLQKLSSVETKDEAVIKRLRLNVRIANIKENLLLVKKQIEGINKDKGFLKGIKA